MITSMLAANGKSAFIKFFRLNATEVCKCVFWRPRDHSAISGLRNIVFLMATGATLRSLNKTIDAIFKIVYLGFHEVKCSHHRKRIIEFRV